jgi:hypothetical protein
MGIGLDCRAPNIVTPRRIFLRKVGARTDSKNSGALVVYRLCSAASKRCNPAKYVQHHSDVKDTNIGLLGVGRCPSNFRTTASQNRADLRRVGVTPGNAAPNHRVRVGHIARVLIRQRHVNCPWHTVWKMTKDTIHSAIFAPQSRSQIFLASLCLPLRFSENDRPNEIK